MTDNKAVWAKIPGYIPWPAIVFRAPENAPPKPDEKGYKNKFSWVYFLGSCNYLWVHNDKLEVLTLDGLEQAKPGRNPKGVASWRKAVKEAKDLLTKRTRKFDIKPYVSHTKKEPEKEKPAIKTQGTKNSKISTTKNVQVKKLLKNPKVVVVKEPIKGKASSALKGAKKNTKQKKNKKTVTPLKNLAKKKTEAKKPNVNKNAVTKKTKKKTEAKKLIKAKVPKKKIGDKKNPKIYINKNGVKKSPVTEKNKSGAKKRGIDSSSDSDNNQNSIDRDLMPPPNKIRKHTQQYAEVSKKQPLDRVYGFMKLNFRACAMIKNILCAGHKINFYLKETDDLMLYEMLVDFTLDAPGSIKLIDIFEDFITLTDIILMYAVDIQQTLYVQETLKQDKFANLLGGKSYVEFSALDFESSLSFSNAIDKKGVRYLEAQLQGNSRDFVKGELIVLASGNKGLYNDVKNLFKSISKETFFLGNQIGKACKGNVILQALRATVLTGFTEALGLANKCGLGSDTFIHVVRQSSLDSLFLRDKSNIIIANNFNKAVEEDVQSIQRDVKMALDLSSHIRLTAHMASSANELLKKAKLNGCSNDDISCIYCITK